jgi:integrase
VTHAFAGLLRSAGIQRGSFHSLRHTQATLLLQQGHNIALVSRRLGHASIGITADIYGHVDPAVDRAAADLVGEALGGLA